MAPKPNTPQNPTAPRVNHKDPSQVTYNGPGIRREGRQDGAHNQELAGEVE